MTTAALFDLLQTEIDRANAAMTARLGEQSLCEIHKDGHVTGGVKYDEGRLVALRGLLRKLRGVQPVDAAAAQVLIVDEQARWARELAKHQSAERKSIAWIAYSQGGTDACAGLLAQVAETG